MRGFKTRIKNKLLKLLIFSKIFDFPILENHIFWKIRIDIELNFPEF